jgi:hypothetical protein
VQTRTRADDQDAIARSEPQAVNRETSSGVESRCADDGVVRRRPDGDRVPRSAQTIATPAESTIPMTYGRDICKLLARLAT